MKLQGEPLSFSPPNLNGGCSNAITWTLFALTQAPMVQSKLREELFTIDTDNPTMDELNGLPYLDMVVRESLRVHAPVPLTSRVAMKDDILPLSEPVTDCKGKVHHTLRKVDFRDTSKFPSV